MLRKLLYGKLKVEQITEGLFNPQQQNHLQKHLSEAALASFLLWWSSRLCRHGPFPFSVPMTVQLRLLKTLWLVWACKVSATTSKPKKPHWSQTQMKGEKPA